MQHTRPHVPTSVVLGKLVDGEPREHVTLGWLMAQLGNRSFGVVLLLLGLLGMVPGVATPAGVLVLVPAFQMILAQANPNFTRRISSLEFRAARVFRMIRRIIPMLHYFERFVRPRWLTPFESTERVVGVIVLLLGLGILDPIPLSNLPPAFLIVLVAFAYLEEDGALLCAALGTAIIFLIFLSVFIWQTIKMAHWLTVWL
ncbi:MAG TPA: exopolysaccharide biosynthesis protein [Rhizomicrobium sp.]